MRKIGGLFVKKRLAFALLALVLLVGCGSQKAESGDYHFTLRFPAAFTVFAKGAAADSSALTAFGLTEEDLTAFQTEENGVFYAVARDDDLTREVVVNVYQNDYAASLWRLREADADSINELTQDAIDDFAAAGVQALQKGQFAQGDAMFVFLNLRSGANTEPGVADTVYCTTVVNGLQYTILYQLNGPLTDRYQKEAQSIFDSFYLTETLQNPNEEPKDTAPANAMLVVVLLAALIFSGVLIARGVASARRRAGEEQPYRPQFEDDLKTEKKKDKTP